MSAELLINITPMESRVALVEQGVLQNISIERTAQRGIVGNIYKGKVARVLPGMQAAFVDIGLDKAGFLHVDDILRPTSSSSAVSDDIRQYLREGQVVVVQVIKDPISTKGARLSTQLMVSSRFLVYMPGVDHVGISQRIDNEDERNRLRQLVNEIAVGDVKTDSEGCDTNSADHAHGYGHGKEEKDGFIIRTAAEGVEKDILLQDVIFLRQLWRHVQEVQRIAPVPSEVYVDLPLYLRCLRDMALPLVDKIRVDSREVFEKLQQFSAQFNPAVQPFLEHYSADQPLFSLYAVEDEINRALHKRVPLKSGGYLVIEQTESMTTIDVNTGAFVGRNNLEETTYKTNLEAAVAIARQLRVRNLGGIIIIDFIDMQEQEHCRQLLRSLEKALSRDPVKTTVYSESALGLVQMTRKRTSESLGQQLCEPCASCEGRGHHKSLETLCYEILREVLREVRAYDSESFLVLAAPEVINRLLDDNSTHVADLETFVARTINFRAEPEFHREQFDIVPL